ncbi:hypothetical protein BDV93DRAFT_515845 [Ceratobasidium sp. AG-I]|nr:hypothetical protein BDV93DRAFT_515845 [Ceratobasidium sp. AG-I]
MNKFPIDSTTKAAVVTVCENYQAQDMNIRAMHSALAQIFGCDAENISPAALKAASWIEACEEASREGDVEPPFPREFEVTGGSGSSDPGRSGGKGKKATGTVARKSPKEVAKRKMESNQERPKPEYNPTHKKVPGTSHYYGDCAAHAIEEDEVTFIGDNDELGDGLLQVRAATNFRFVDEVGCDVSVGPGPVNHDNPIYLVAACGSLNLSLESGQRLTAGWWNSDPDPELAAWKAPAEIIWLKISVQAVYVDSELNLRNENKKLVVVDGTQGTYVLQCPEVGYTIRWKFSFKNFAKASRFEAVIPLGRCPDWYEEILWEELKVEYQRFKSANDVDPPAPPATTNAERLLLKLQSDMAFYEAVLRNAQQGLKWCKKKRAATKGGKAGKIGKTGKKGKKGGKVVLTRAERVLNAEAASVIKKQKGLTEEAKRAIEHIKLLKPKIQAQQTGLPEPTPASPASVPEPTPSPSPSPSPSPAPAPSPPPLPSPSSAPLVDGQERHRDGPAPSSSVGNVGSYREPNFAKQSAKRSDDSNVVNVPRTSDSDDRGSGAAPGDSNNAAPPNSEALMEMFGNSSGMQITWEVTHEGCNQNVSDYIAQPCNLHGLPGRVPHVERDLFTPDCLSIRTNVMTATSAIQSTGGRGKGDKQWIGRRWPFDGYACASSLWGLPLRQWRADDTVRAGSEGLGCRFGASENVATHLVDFTSSALLAPQQTVRLVDNLIVEAVGVGSAALLVINGGGFLGNALPIRMLVRKGAGGPGDLAPWTLCPQRRNAAFGRKARDQRRPCRGKGRRAESALRNGKTGRGRGLRDEPMELEVQNAQRTTDRPLTGGCYTGRKTVCADEGEGMHDYTAADNPEASAKASCARERAADELKVRFKSLEARYNSEVKSLTNQVRHLEGELQDPQAPNATLGESIDCFCARITDLEDSRATIDHSLQAVDAKLLGDSVTFPSLVP